MNKLNPIKYIENMISHHPKSISLWITEGIVINGERYIIKEFRIRDGNLYAVIAENKYTPEYFEVQLAPDEETLKDVYQAIKDNKIAIEQEITDRKNEISRVDSAIKANTTKIDQEITDRKNEINRVEAKVEANTAKINQEITDRRNEISHVDNAIKANTAKINKEITDRQNEISHVDGKIEANTAKINKEITDRQHEISHVDNAIAANTKKINQEITDRTDEINRVNESIESNTAKINQEITDHRNEISRVDNAIKANTAKINQEIVDRKADIGVVNEAISSNTAKINKEITDRQSEISRVDGKIEANTAKINKEITDRTNEITRVDGAINANTAKINKEIQDRKNEITRVENKIPTNVSTRNLILKSNDFANPHKQNGANTEVTSTNEYFVIKSTGCTVNTWGGISWNMSISEVKAGEQFSILMPVYIDSSVPLDNGWSFIIKNHTLNSSAFDYSIPTNKKDQWFNVAITFKAYKDVILDTYPFYICIIKNGLVRIKPPMLVRGNLIPSDYQPAFEDTQAKITSVENRLITNLDSLNSMPGTLNAVKLTPGSITGDMVTGGRLRSTNGWTVIDLTSGIITFNGSSSYIQHSKNNKIFEIQSLLINGSAYVRENMIASFGIRKSDNSSKSGIRFSLYNPVGNKPTAQADINADSFSLLDSQNTPLLSVNGSNTYLGNWNIYGWGDIPLAFVNGGLTAKDVGLKGHTESLKKIIEKLCTKTGITWL